MDIAHTMSEGLLGTRAENTVDALKEYLGVEQLTLVVLDSLDEYRELLVEAPPKAGGGWRKRVVLTLLVLIAFTVFAGLFHPGVRIDYLVKNLSVQVQ